MKNAVLKTFFLLSFAVLSLCVLPVCSLAVQEDLPPVPTDDTAASYSASSSDTDRPIVVNLEVTPPSVNVQSPALELPVELFVESSDETETEPEPVYPSYSVLSLLPPSDTDSDSIQGVLEALFGSYEPRTQTVTQYLPDGTSVSYDEYVPGLPGIDWPWIASVIVFLVMLYCLFRLLGGVITRV